MVGIMQFKWKWIWYALLSLVGVLTFFEVPLPTTWDSLMDWLRAADCWVLTHAHRPGLFAVFLGLLLGTVIIPELWGYIRRHFLDETYPDMTVLDALNYVIHDSKWAVREKPRMGLLPASAEFVQRALNEDFVVWGRRENGGTHKRPEFSQKELPIPAEHWKDFELDLENIFEHQREHRPQTKPENPNNRLTQNIARYTRLRVNHRQIRQGEWARALFWRRHE